MTTTWTVEDAQAAALIAAYFPDARFVEVIPHTKENNVTDTAPENVWEGEDAQEAPALGGATYPERPDNPHEAPLSVNFKPGGTPQLTVRGRTVQEHMDLLQQVQSSGLLGLIQSVSSAFGGQGAPPAPMPQGFQGAATPPPFGPNVSVPQAPGYQGPPVQQQAPQWGAPQAQAAPQWGGGQQQGQRKEYPAPQGWLRLNGARKEQVDAIAQQMGIPKGNPNKGGAYNFFGLTPGGQPGKSWYCSPQAAQAFAQFNPMPA